MICPNCQIKMKNGICIRCGYMNNGNTVNVKKDITINDLEKYLGNDYQKIYYNENSLVSFFLGPLYFFYLNYPLIAFLFIILDMVTIFTVGYIVAFIPILGAFSPICMIMTFVFNRLIFSAINNMLYLSLLKHKIKRIKKRENLELYIQSHDIKAGSIIYFTFYVSILILFIVYLISMGNS